MASKRNARPRPGHAPIYGANDRLAQSTDASDERIVMGFEAGAQVRRLVCESAGGEILAGAKAAASSGCLLYTSDAADE